jgi:hypothetical protein
LLSEVSLNLSRPSNILKRVAVFGDSLATEGFSKQGFINVLRKEGAMNSLVEFKNFGANGQGVEKIYQRFVDFCNNEFKFSNSTSIAEQKTRYEQNTLVENLNQDSFPKQNTIIPFTDIVILAGINDAWKYPLGRGAPVEKFHRVLRELLIGALSTDCTVTYVMPHFIALKPQQHVEPTFDRLLKEYLEVAKEIASELVVCNELFNLIDLRQVFEVEVIGLDRAGHLYSRDGVHLNELGQARLAAEILKIINAH